MIETISNRPISTTQAEALLIPTSINVYREDLTPLEEKVILKCTPVGESFDYHIHQLRKNGRIGGVNTFLGSNLFDTQRKVFVILSPIRYSPGARSKTFFENVVRSLWATRECCIRHNCRTVAIDLDSFGPLWLQSGDFLSIEEGNEMIEEMIEGVFDPVNGQVDVELYRVDESDDEEWNEHTSEDVRMLEEMIV